MDLSRHVFIKPLPINISSNITKKDGLEKEKLPAAPRRLASFAIPRWTALPTMRYDTIRHGQAGHLSIYLSVLITYDDATT